MEFDYFYIPGGEYVKCCIKKRSSSSVKKTPSQMLFDVILSVFQLMWGMLKSPTISK